MLNTLIVCVTVLISIYLIRDTVFKLFGYYAPTKEPNQIDYDEDVYVIPDIPETPDKEWAGTPDNPYSPELGSDQLHELHAEMDSRIADLLKELEYEEKQKAYVEEATKGIVFSEDAEVLVKQMAQKTEIEVAQ